MKKLQNFNWSVDEILDMFPWERTMTIAMTNQYIKEKLEELRKT